MAEEKKETIQDHDFKYVMIDTGNLYLGAKFTFRELLEQEMLPFKMKAIISHYLLKETDQENTLESQLYYLEKGNFLYDTLIQLKVKVKVTMPVEKKSLTGKSKSRYIEEIFPLAQLADMNLARKKAAGIMIQEMIIPKLALMSFCV